MSWELEENNEKDDIKKGNKATKIILIFIILFTILIIALFSLLFYITNNTFKLVVDGKQINKYSEDMIQKVDNNIYISLKDFASLAGYTYHNGEYKVYSQDPTKAYVESDYETASFYLNSNKICKLEPNSTEDYEVFTVKENIREINGKLYAPIEAINIGFNVYISYTDKLMSVSTLKSLVTSWTADTALKGYQLSENFQNQKAILYGYLIVKKEEKGLYGIVDTKYKEIIPERYTSIDFLESIKEFMVTTNQNKVGIVDSEGKNKINQIYDSIKLIDREEQLYLVSYEKKYGVVANDGKYLIHPEYDKIGINSINYNNLENQYILLDNLIPVCKNEKWGAFDKKGTMIASTIYNGFGCETLKAEIGGDPVLEIKEANAIVIKKGELYGIISEKGEELIPPALTEVYSITNAGVTTCYMNYKNKQIDVLEYIEKNLKKNNVSETNNNINKDTNNTTYQEYQNEILTTNNVL